MLRAGLSRIWGVANGFQAGADAEADFSPRVVSAQPFVLATITMAGRITRSLSR